MDEMRRSAMAPEAESACRQSAGEIGSSDDSTPAPRSSSGEQRAPGLAGRAKARGFSAVGAVGAMRRILRVDK
jgi:hypothetical protein